ncbi:ANTAR domain-containing protein [Streptomyces sp. NPDC023838]|uniref:ANTAR domain-containing protein n=1 Tax=Streptomyces sp. NPDC023838 TaxID=3154325 RepID=UPI0034006E54
MAQPSHTAEPGSTGSAGTCLGGARPIGTRRLSGLSVRCRRDGDRTVVSVSGELDLALDLTVDQQLQHALQLASSCSEHSDEGVGLGLGGVGRCDCSTVHIWLTIGEPSPSAPGSAAPVAAGPDGAAAPRDHTAPTDKTDRTDHASHADQADHADPEADAGLELGQLRRAMESRGTIDLARGILMAAFGVSPEDAWSALVMTSQNTNTKLYRVAQQVVDSAGGAPLPQPVRRQLSAAMAKLSTADSAPGAAQSTGPADAGLAGSEAP